MKKKNIWAWLEVGSCWYTFALSCLRYLNFLDNYKKIFIIFWAFLDNSQLFGIGGPTDEVPDLLLNEDTSSVITTSKRRSVGEAGG